MQTKSHDHSFLTHINALDSALAEIHAIANALAVGAITEDGQMFVFPIKTISTLINAIMYKTAEAVTHAENIYETWQQNARLKKDGAED